MIYLVLSFLFSVASCARPTADSLNPQYSFGQYLTDFGKEYSASELTRRGKIFSANMNTILKINSDPASTWKAGVNRFTDQSIEEINMSKGLNRGALLSSKKTKSPVPKLNHNLSDLPDAVDWRSAGVISPVKDQGSCGSCWAFGATATMESFVALSTGHLTEISQQELVSCMPNSNNCGGTGGCEGATAELAFDYIAEYGIASVWSYGYQSATYGYAYTSQNGVCQRGVYLSSASNPSSVYQAAPRSVTTTGYNLLTTNDYNEVMTTLATVGPLAINVDASTWHLYESGVFSGCPRDATINHVVQLTGYGSEDGEDFWTIRNSWSTDWGEQGYMRLARSESDNYCGTDYFPAAGVTCDNGPSSVEVCGMCGVLYDVSYPTGAGLFA